MGEWVDGCVSPCGPLDLGGKVAEQCSLVATA